MLYGDSAKTVFQTGLSNAADTRALKVVCKLG